jgi:TolA-binding protein
MTMRAHVRGKTMSAALAIFLSACGGGAGEAGDAKVASPVVQVAPVHPVEEGKPEPEEVGSVEVNLRPKVKAVALDACLPELRQGRHLPEAAKAGPDATEFAAALASERDGKVDAARKGYLQVIMKWPKSPYIPLAYLAFGELFLRESDKDPSKLDLARQSYLEVLKFGPGERAGMLLATYRLGEVEQRAKEPAKAMAMLKRAIDTAAQWPDTLCAGPIDARARTGMVSAYAEAGRSERAYDFFRRLGGTDEPQAFGMVVSLAEVLVSKQMADEALAALGAASSQKVWREDCQREGALLEALRRGAPRPAQLDAAFGAHASRCPGG